MDHAWEPSFMRRGTVVDVPDEPFAAVQFADGYVIDRVPSVDSYTPYVGDKVIVVRVAREYVIIGGHAP